MYEYLNVQRQGAVATVVVNRPSVLNALNAGTLDELDAAMGELGADDGVRAIVLTGAGEKAFVAGADINELARQVPVGGREMALRGQHVLDRVEHLGKPVIAAINGFALGGGCELALACAFRFMADTARMGLPEINLGIMPGYAGTQRLTRLVGRGVALDLILTGRHVAAEEALRVGLVHRVVSAATLAETATSFATELAAKAPIAMRLAMEAVLRGADLPFAEACRYEATLFGLLAATDDMREGTRAFLEKRPPTFKGQ
jgi:enoyl-CoA hydratase